MSELNEPRWSVLSERGREASGLTYDGAVRLEDRLRAERVYGLCIITDEAARRLPDAQPQSKTGAAPAGKRAPRRKSAKKSQRA